jgi:aspartyl-tRNA(Asn)/glutamyl-tRNA(Gln) amidotransferase subunit A
MAGPASYSVAEIEAFARRFGLSGLSAEHLRELAERAGMVAALGRDLPRMPRKDAEPAHVFRVPLK